MLDYYLRSYQRTRILSTTRLRLSLQSSVNAKALHAMNLSGRTRMHPSSCTSLLVSLQSCQPREMIETSEIFCL